MRRFCWLLLFLPGSAAFSCNCWNFHRDINRAYKEYDFIAHVRIGKKQLLTERDSGLVHDIRDLSLYRKVEVEILELFKGRADIKILEWGVGSSCDMGLRENAEWILFGYQASPLFINVNACNTWFQLTNEAGERKWLYDGSIDAMHQLRKLANIPERKMEDGRHHSYYENNVLLADEGYRDGMLDGYRKIYYGNGNLMKEGMFRMGKPEGLQREYAPHGQLLSELNYTDGQITHSVWWYDTSYQERKQRTLFLEEFRNTGKLVPPLIRKSSEGWLDLLTGNRFSRVYRWDGKTEKEHFTFNQEQDRLTCEYYGSGALEAEIRYFGSGNISIEKRWDEKGVLLSDKRWEKGKPVPVKN